MARYRQLTATSPQPNWHKYHPSDSATEVDYGIRNRMVREQYGITMPIPNKDLLERQAAIQETANQRARKQDVIKPGEELPWVVLNQI